MISLFRGQGHASDTVDAVVVSPRDAIRFVDLSDWRTSAASTECLPWKGSRTPFGHGRFRVGAHVLKAHRVAYALFHGSCPGHLVVRHRCNNAERVNPHHLELGTVAENNLDARLAGRARKPPVHRGTSHHAARVVQVNGVRATVAEHARTAGLTAKTVYSRLARGWSVHRALSTPARSTP